LYLIFGNLFFREKQARSGEVRTKRRCPWNGSRIGEIPARPKCTMHQRNVHFISDILKDIYHELLAGRSFKAMADFSVDAINFQRVVVECYIR
jgi:hypothetical protein